MAVSFYIIYLDKKDTSKEENKKTFKNVLTINPKDVIINKSSKTTQ